MATVVRAWSSAPHGVGASMLVAEDGRVAGAVSGGCVEAAVCEMAEEVLRSGIPAAQSFGVADEDAFSIGLTCGGTIEVFVREIGAGAPVAEVADALGTGAPVALVTLLRPGAGAGHAGASLAVSLGGVTGSLGSAALDRAAASAARDLLASGRSGTLTPDGPGGCAADTDSGAEILVQSFGRPPQLVIFGANDFARPLADLGARLGHQVTVCDARPVFATAERFPAVHEVVVDWPHRWFGQHGDRITASTAVCVLTHDAKFDVPLLEVALRSPAGYVGAMGSRRTHQDRLARLRRAGVAAHELARLRSPIGLDLSGRGPEETALSILAEITALRRGGTGRPLVELERPIHAPETAVPSHA
jgi:xanthine dehydrogenase accessory factor